MSIFTAIRSWWDWLFPPPPPAPMPCPARSRDTVARELQRERERAYIMLRSRGNLSLRLGRYCLVEDLDELRARVLR